jgi:hypothetical protein
MAALAPSLLGHGLMSEPRLRSYEYVNAPFDAVRKALREQPLEIFRRATRSAAARSNAVGASLHAGFTGVEVGVDVRIQVQGMREEEGIAGLSPVTKITMGWEAERVASLFPVMRAELSFWPLTSTETQLELQGTYRPPLGIVGHAFDAAIGHRIAEAAVHRFLREIVEELRSELVRPG